VDPQILLQWVANNFIDCLVTKSVLLKKFRSGQDSFWTWSSLSDLAFALMVLDVYHEKWLQDYTVLVTNSGDKRTRRVITATDTIKKSRYTFYKATLREMVANYSEGEETWKTIFSKNFWDAYMVRKGETRREGSGGVEVEDDSDDGDMPVAETSLQVRMEDDLEWDSFE